MSTVHLKHYTKEKQNKLQYATLTIGVLPTYEMFVGLQDAPQLSIIIDDPLQSLRCQDAAGGRAVPLRRLQPHAHLLHERLYARAQTDRRVLVDAHRDASVHHPAEKASSREGKPTPGWLPLAQ